MPCTASGALVQVERVLTQFRARFIGKVSPVHFFWGAFDLAVTRFSGGLHPSTWRCPQLRRLGDGRGALARSLERGFLAERVGEASFYAYTYPVPPGFTDYPIQPEAAYFHQALGEFVLPYDAVRRAGDPDQMLLLSSDNL